MLKLHFFEIGSPFCRFAKNIAKMVPERDECRVRKLAALDLDVNYSPRVEQVDQHIGALTVRETLDFAARCQGVGHKEGEFFLALGNLGVSLLCKLNSAFGP